jgi:hypothetical protein
VQSLVEHVIKNYRQGLGIEEIWKIDVQVCCPEQLPQAEASIWWDAECWFARLHVRCNLSGEFLSWLVLHELCELQAWRTSSFALQLIDQYPLRLPRREDYRAAYKREWQRLRNQEIEWRIFGLTGQRRPEHLTNEEWDGIGEWTHYRGEDQRENQKESRDE